jgi:hypothetical protein
MPLYFCLGFRYTSCIELIKEFVMKFYEVSYPGRALGGVAIVRAKNQEDAIEAVFAETPFVTRGEFEAKEIKLKKGENVIWNWNGDY